MSINFSEMMLVLLVALLVIKPEKIPNTAYTLGKWMRFLRSNVDKLKRDLQEPLDK